MNYELAKQLKDAGFPLRKQDICAYHAEESPLEECDCEVIPTLSELIEACGEEFVALVRWEDDLWRASNCERDTPMIERGMDIHGEGKTPEEAVAKLWLELNQKNER